MRRSIRKPLKRLAMRLPYSGRLEYLLALPKLRAWAEEQSVAALPVFKTRRDLYAHVAGELAGAPLLYLEFGVWRGQSTGYWLDLDRHPGSRFVGFDTFTGLPGAWRHGLMTDPAGAFDAGGEPPDLGDPRVSWRKGLFQDTLPGFLAEDMPRLLEGRALVINLDADLYSSTLYALTRLDPHLDGAVVLFDEFSAVLDEFRALGDYCAAYRRAYTVLAVERHLDRIAVRFQG